MFEKEAEKIAERKISNFIPQQWGVSLIRTEPTWETVEGAPHFYLNSLAKMWQEGAEFGYNKANEWHYVKDGDLPKVGVQVLSEQGTLVIYKGEGFNWVEYSPNADNIKLRKWEEPIAWKEIVLPKEIE